MILDIKQVNRLYQVYALKNALYIYQQKELFDIINTAENLKGLFSMTTFDEDRFMVATISEKSVTSVQIREYPSYTTYEIENVFGELSD